MKQFNVCPQKLHTLFYIMVNDYFMYHELFEREGWRDIDYMRGILNFSFADGFELTNDELEQLQDWIRELEEGYDDDSDDSNIIYLDSDSDD